MVKISWSIGGTSGTQISSGRSKRLAHGTFSKGIDIQIAFREQTLLVPPAEKIAGETSTEKSAWFPQPNIQREFSNFCPLRPKMIFWLQNLYMLTNNNNNNNS